MIPGLTYITSYIDAVFGDTVISISLGSTCAMRFTRAGFVRARRVSLTFRCVPETASAEQPL